MLPFELANAPATFQNYINNVLRDLLNVICLAYLDDILIFSRTLEEYSKHVKIVLEHLCKWNLYCKLLKCIFVVTKVTFLGFILTTHGIAIEQDRIQTISNWPEPQNVTNIQSFVGFASFYRRFIARFSTIAAPLNKLLKSIQAQSKNTFVLPSEARQFFQTLNEAFTKAPLLLHFDLEKPIQLETDASVVAIARILSQPEIYLATPEEKL